VTAPSCLNYMQCSDGQLKNIIYHFFTLLCDPKITYRKFATFHLWERQSQHCTLPANMDMMRSSRNYYLFAAEQTARLRVLENRPWEVVGVFLDFDLREGVSKIESVLHSDIEDDEPKLVNSASGKDSIRIQYSQPTKHLKAIVLVHFLHGQLGKYMPLLYKYLSTTVQISICKMTLGGLLG